MSTTDFAVQVCITCKMRKKGCDKKLPSCGYCNRRGLVCLYDPSGALNLPKRTAHLCGPEVPFSLPPIATITTSRDTTQGECPSARSRLLLRGPLSDFLSPSSHLLPPKPISTAIEATLHMQVHEIIQTTGQAVEDITFRYFQGCHKWLPFIPTRQFRTRLDAPATSDVSILLLSMCLITYYPLVTGLSIQLVDEESLYLATKALFAQVQTLVPASPSLIQAGVLISIYEFAHGWLRSAYLSIGVCARMAYSIGIHKFKHVEGKINNETDLEAEENRNLWWGIVICERSFFCEVIPPDQPFASIFPGADYPLPSEFSLPGQANEAVCNEPIKTPLLPPLLFNSSSGFGRQAQAVCLLEKVFSAIKIVDIRDLQSALLKLDVDLQTFLSTVMDQCDGTWGRFCGSIAISIRALFTLHLHLLSQAPVTKVPEEWQKISLAALDTATKIMIDIAHSHNENITHSNIDALPPTSLYTLLASLEHHKKSRYHHDDAWDRDFQALSNMAGHFKLRWSNEYRVICHHVDT